MNKLPTINNINKSVQDFVMSAKGSTIFILVSIITTILTFITSVLTILIYLRQSTLTVIRGDSLYEKIKEDVIKEVVPT